MVGVTKAQQSLQNRFGWNPIIISMSSQNLCRPAGGRREGRKDGEGGERESDPGLTRSEAANSILSYVHASRDRSLWLVLERKGGSSWFHSSA